MAANDSSKAQLALSVTASPNLCIDLWKGFSGTISINVYAAERTLNGEPPPFAEYISTCLDWYHIPPIWALTKGLLAIRDESGTVVDINNESLLDFQHSVPDAVQYLRGYRVNEHKLDRIPRRLLGVLRSKLKPGSTYRLGFRENTFPMRARRLGPGSGGSRLRPVRDDHWVRAMCDRTEVPFQVVAGTPIPRFLVALSLSKTPRGQGIYPNKLQYSINLKISSLDKMSVMVRMPDPRFQLVPKGLGEWLRVCQPKELFSPTRLFDGLNEGCRQTWQKDNGKITAKCPSVLTFHPGTSYTVRCALSNVLCDLLESGLEMVALVVADRSGFSTWKYSDERDERADSQKVCADQWPEHGHIELEPVLDGWDDMEQMLEQEQLLFRLPPELRRIIYDHVKFAEGVEMMKII